MNFDLYRIIGGTNGRILGSICYHWKDMDVSEIFHWFQVFLTSVEKDIGKILTDAQSAKKKNEFSD